MESPMSNVCSSPIPWPSAGRRNKKPRHLVSKGLIKPSKLSTKYPNSSGKSSKPSGKSSNPCCSPKLTVTTVKRRSDDKVYKDFTEAMKIAISDCSSSSSSMLLRLSPTTMEESSLDNKYTLTHNHKLTLGVKESCVEKVIPQFLDSDSSPEPLIKRITGSKTPGSKDSNFIEPQANSLDFKTPVLKESNKTETLGKVLPKSTPKWFSVADPRRALQNAILSSSDDEIPPLSQRITKTQPTKKPSTRKPHTTKTTGKGVKKTQIDVHTSSESSITDSPILFPNLDSDPSPLIQSGKKYRTPRLIISSDSDSSIELKSTKSINPIKKPIEGNKLSNVKETSSTKKTKKTETNLNKLVLTKTPLSKFKNVVINECTKSPSSKARDCSLKDANDFVASLEENYLQNEMHPDAVAYVLEFTKKKEDLAHFLYSLFNKHVFQDQLPPKMLITWKPRMTNTAGFCTFRKRIVSSVPGSEIRTATIELSIKVLDAPNRLRCTLIHEMCHAATWIISGIKDAHHGTVWKNWCTLANRTLPSLPPIKRTHNYPIKTKYVYRCTQCAGSIGRHSKSLDITRKVCGRCRGRFELLVNGKVVASAATNQSQIPNPTLTPFAKFVKENYKVLKQNDPKSTHGDIMKKLGKNFIEKANSKDF